MQGSCQFVIPPYPVEKVATQARAFIFSGSPIFCLGKFHQKVAETCQSIGGLWQCSRWSMDPGNLILSKCAWHTTLCSC